MLLAGVLCAFATPVLAQEASGDSSQPVRTDAEWKAWVPDSAEVQMPELAFAETAEHVKDYHKYYYFHRKDTSFAEALGDIRECDDYARGLVGVTGSYDAAMGGALVQYGMLGGVLGGLIGGVLSDAIHGSAEERRKRRVNMRRCMFFKEYQRYGLVKNLWEEFNFEEGNGKVPEPERQPLLAIQARVASGPVPVAEDLGL